MKQITCYDVAKQPTLVGQKWGSAPYLPEGLKQAIAFIRKLVVVSHTAEQVKTRKTINYVCRITQSRTVASSTSGGSKINLCVRTRKICTSRYR